jgi:hypothetical protein
MYLPEIDSERVKWSKLAENKIQWSDFVEKYNRLSGCIKNCNFC